MTPSNPDNQQPLIYRIADAAGVFHLVAPVTHTHSQSEVDGLVAKINALDILKELTLSEGVVINVFGSIQGVWQSFICHNNTGSDIMLYDTFDRSSSLTGHEQLVINTENILIPAGKHYAIRLYNGLDVLDFPGFERAMYAAYVEWGGFVNLIPIE